MPFLDVSEILSDPDFADTTLIRTRNTQTVDDDGNASNASESLGFTGVVTNNTGDLLVRMAEGSRIKDAITIHTVTELVAGRDGVSADVVTWLGRQFTVSSVSDWSTYGNGFYAANCDLIPLSG